MYVHIGGEASLPDSCVIGVFDLDATTHKGSATHAFLARAEDVGNLEVVSPELPRSFVLTSARVYLTPVTTSTLRRRFAAGAHRLHARRVRK